MKDFFESLKDILYDSIDYIIMFAIIIGVVFVIGWRLDVLFAKDALDMPAKENPVVSVDKPNNLNKDPKQDDEEDKSEDPTKDPNDNTENPKEDNVVTIPDPPPVSNDPIKINIPAGSLPSKIGSILESNGLISSRTEFIQKAIELKLDTKLKSGNFTIPANSSIEEILKIITK